jgi:hypothetical protein
MRGRRGGGVAKAPPCGVGLQSCHAPETETAAPGTPAPRPSAPAACRRAPRARSESVAPGWARAATAPETRPAGDVGVWTAENTIQYNTIQYNTIQYNTIQYNTIQYNTIQYNTIQYNTIQYNTIQYNTIQYKRTRGRRSNAIEQHMCSDSASGTVQDTRQGPCKLPASLERVCGPWAHRQV